MVEDGDKHLQDITALQHVKHELLKVHEKRAFKKFQNGDKNLQLALLKAAASHLT